eukprot:TRINITY_DN617_c1_g3_i1.p1 TRINITY_DN617_c1_g3~~TRINITY_DN617_c1_g3_i1.p1  ORF type:complete len:152 (+),score=63.12 TRINITY_DN617_c1_g3_i1:141-596(+)
MGLNEEQLDTLIKKQSKKLLTYAFTASCAHLYMYHAIFELPLVEYAPIFVLVTLFSTVLLKIIYRNFAITAFDRILTNNTKQGKVEKIKKTGYENYAIAVSVLFTNSVFFTIVILIGSFFFSTTSGPNNYVVSVGLATTLLTLGSTHHLDY